MGETFNLLTERVILNSTISTHWLNGLDLDDPLKNQFVINQTQTNHLQTLPSMTHGR